jgi:DnaJ like chaperone protein
MKKWLGKIIGAAVGLALLRHPLGLLFGLLVGHMYDIGGFSFARPPRRVARSFVDPLFGLIGAMAKADGRVSEDEIAAVEQLMQRMGLGPVQRHEAIACFNAGKSPGFVVDRAIRDLRSWCLGRRDHAYVLIDVLLDVVFSDGSGTEPRMQLMRRMCSALGVQEREIAVLAAMKGHIWATAGSAGQSYSYRHGGGTAAPPPAQTSGPDPYAVLGVARGVDEGGLKRAWRKLMSEHHPDKLGDVPAPLRERAEQRARDINTAYERIKAERGFR